MFNVCCNLTGPGAGLPSWPRVAPSRKYFGEARVARVAQRVPPALFTSKILFFCYRRTFWYFHMSRESRRVRGPALVIRRYLEIDVTPGESPEDVNTHLKML